MSSPSVSRREFLATSGSCAAHLALAAAGSRTLLGRVWAVPERGAVVAREPFGTLEKVADGVWALVSDPFHGDRTTISNGGIVVGRDAMLAIEGFNTPEGARWLATKARELTGRWPTHVALTHYHADHANGVAGYLAEDRHPVVRSTARTRELVLQRNQPADAARAGALQDVVLLPGDAPTVLDLGGRTVRVIPRAGHTDSDVSLELDEPSLIFCGDLFWNGIFPNYVDAAPSRLAASVRAMRRTRDTIYVPGHGAVGRLADYDRHAAVLDAVEEAARRGHAQGLTAADAAAKFALPPSLGEWTLFNKAFFERAFGAWYREMGA